MLHVLHGRVGGWDVYLSAVVLPAQHSCSASAVVSGSEPIPGGFFRLVDCAVSGRVG